MAENGSLIHDIFRPVRFIAEGGFGLIYEGIFFPMNLAVIKFI